MAPLDFSCPRLQAVELLHDSPRGQVWINNEVEGLRLTPSLRPLLQETDAGVREKSPHIALLWPKFLRGIFENTPPTPRPQVDSKRRAEDTRAQTSDQDSMGDAAPAHYQGRCTQNMGSRHTTHAHALRQVVGVCTIAHGALR